ncbi:Os04g0309751 [Oryza sativa Japonica Group]|uniref:Os04g0309751 protein n=1 Tax=Oryza sativa subsp. japonica TaxID=39947 RepID=A0A0P0W8E0_ORYSJ|nr:hypothetical protein EE612_023043 [Oryza sativa]BAS88515.1 Os04g0309751 [Oryza sativa Japonica Group]
MGFTWKPETPSMIISAGPPWFVAKVGNPQFIASMTVSPNASYSAGCTNAPFVSAMQRYSSPLRTRSVCALIQRICPLSWYLSIRLCILFISSISSRSLDCEASRSPATTTRLTRSLSFLFWPYHSTSPVMFFTLSSLAIEKMIGLFLSLHVFISVILAVQQFVYLWV